MKEKYNFNYKKKYGQNFLQDNNILDNIVRESEITSNTLVIEIGVGAGALTKLLLKKAKMVIGYEIDISLKNHLYETFKNDSNVNIIFDDFLKRSIKNDISCYDYDEIMVVANLPYYITTPIIMKLIDEDIDIKRMVLMVQNEVADRFNAKEGNKNYNSLTIYLQYYFKIKKAFVVSRNCFFPKPNVDSAVVVFEHKVSKYNLINENLFFKVVRDSFRQKRKTLKNNLYDYDTNKINEVLKKFHKDISFRAEEISIDEFVEIANALAKN